MANVTFSLQPPIGFIVSQAGAFRAQLENLQPLWDKFKPLVSEVEAAWWASEGGGGWPDGPDYHGLVRTGALQSSMVDPGQAVQSEGPREMVWGSDVFYAVFHHAGMGHNPVRELVDDTVESRRQFEQVTVQWVNEVAARTFGAI